MDCSRSPYAECWHCPLYKPPLPRRDPQVNGNGPDQSDIVIVGMAPGDTEVTLKKVFVGPSGRMINSALEAAGIERSEVYVTNAVLCSTHDGHRNQPLPATAITACRTRLYMEVKARRPKVVVALGNEALRAFGVDERVSDCRGRERWVSYEDLARVLLKAQRRVGSNLPVGFGDWARDGFYLLPSYHPAYCLRSQDYTPDLERDIAKIPTLLDKAAAEVREMPDVTWHVAEDPTDAVTHIRALNQEPILACDIESTGLDPITGRLLTLAYAKWSDGQPHALVIPARLLVDPVVRTSLRDLHRSESTRFVWWYGKFDRKWYRRYLNIDARIDGDGLLAHYAIDARKGVHGLKERSSDDLGADDYEAELKAWTKKNGWEGFEQPDAPLADLYHYTALDVGMTLQLTERYEREMGEREQWVYRNLLLPTAHVLSDMELAGAQVDVEALQSLDAQFVELLAGYQRRMWDAVGVEFNIASQPQIATILYGHKVREQFPSIDKASSRAVPETACLNLPLVVNQKRTPGTGAEHCDKILNAGDLSERAIDFLNALRSYRLDAMLHKTYVRKVPRVVGADGRVRANFNQHVTTTGRLSSSEPINLQNIPTRRKEGAQIKDAFVAAPGRLLVEVDLSQAELRTAAFLSGDPALVEIYAEGRDFHHEVALSILGSEQLAVELRPYIKTFNFAMAYGAEVKTLTALLNDSAIETEQRTKVPQPRWEEDRVKELYDGFWLKFPVLKRWLDDIYDQVLETGEVTSHFGRTRRWYQWTPELKKEAGNHPVQSTAADCLTLAMIELDAWLQRTGYGQIILTVHDSMVIETHELAAVHVADKAVQIMRDVPRKYGITVPFEADAKIGQRWASLLKLKDWIGQTD